MPKPTLMACLLALLLLPVSGFTQSATTVEVTFGGFCAIAPDGKRLVLPQFQADSPAHDGVGIPKHSPYVTVVTGQASSSVPHDGIPGGHKAWYLKPGKLSLNGFAGKLDPKFSSVIQMKTICPTCGIGQYVDKDSAFWDYTAGELSATRNVKFGFVEVAADGGVSMKEAAKEHPTLLALKGQIAGNALTIQSGQSGELEIRVLPVNGSIMLEIKNTPSMRTDSFKASQPEKLPDSKTSSKGSVSYDRHFELYYKLDPKADKHPYRLPTLPPDWMMGPDCVPPVQF